MDPSSTDAGVAAGAALAEAEHAAEAAEEATTTAEVAEDVADAALETAWDAQSAVYELSDRVDLLAARVEQLEAPASGSSTSSTEDGAEGEGNAPERSDKPAKAAGKAEGGNDQGSGTKKKSGGWMWWD